VSEQLPYKYTKNIQLPGLLIRLFKGLWPIECDTAFVNNLYLASRPRAFLENMQLSRRRDGVAKTLTKKEIEKRLEKLCHIHGNEELNQLIDQAKVLSKKLHMEKEYQSLSKLISAILGTNEISILNTDAARARDIGEPYDSARIELFAKLLGALKTQPLQKRKQHIEAAYNG